MVSAIVLHSIAHMTTSIAIGGSYTLISAFFDCFNSEIIPEQEVKTNQKTPHYVARERCFLV